MTEYTNSGDKPAEITPVLDLQGAAPMTESGRQHEVPSTRGTRIAGRRCPSTGSNRGSRAKTMNMPLALKTLTIPPGQKARWVLTINRNGFDNSKPVEWAEAEKLRKDAIPYWEKSAGIPYRRDPGSRPRDSGYPRHQHPRNVPDALCHQRPACLFPRSRPDTTITGYSTDRW